MLATYSLYLGFWFESLSFHYYAVCSVDSEEVEKEVSLLKNQEDKLS